jgi:hypothetical protein
MHPDRLAFFSHAVLFVVVPAQVSSCFSQLLNLHNLSEEISNAQLERAVRIGEVHSLALAACRMHSHDSTTFLVHYSDSSGYRDMLGGTHMAGTLLQEHRRW